MKKWFIVIVSVLAFVPIAGATGNTRPQDVFEGMKESFRPDRARGVDARYAFELTGPDGGKWWIEVKNQACRFGRGSIAGANVTFITSDRDWVGLSNGELSGVWAVVTGRLKIHGDRSLARKLDAIFP